MQPSPPPSPSAELPVDEFGRHRRDIETLDRRILHLVRERLDLAREIGVLKSTHGIPVRNFEVEAKVRARLENAGRELGCPPDLGRDLALFLIEKAVEEQAVRRDALYDGDARSAVVIGGKGGMGRWLARFLRGQGHRVSVHDPTPGENGFAELTSLEDAVSADLVLVAVPMSECAAVLEELVDRGTRGVVAEICSLKGHLAPTLDRVRARGLRVVSFHPLFGPGVRMLSDRTILFCREGGAEERDAVRSLFANTSARLVETDLVEHDRLMGVILGTTHMTNLAFALALRRSGIDAAALAAAAGVTFQKQFATTREVCGENPSLYFEIQTSNRIAEDATQALRLALEEWNIAVESPDASRFAELMRTCRTHLDDVAAASEKGPR